MFNFFARLLGNRLVQAMLVTAVFIGSYNVVMAADEKPATIGEAVEKYVEAQNEIDGIMADIDTMNRAQREYIVCLKLVGPEGDCSKEWNAFQKALDQK